MDQPTDDTPTNEPDDEINDARDHVHTLRDSGRILVRALRADDRSEMAARYEELSPASRRLRFFNAPKHLSGRLLDYLVDVDGLNRFALGAQAIDEPGHPGVGVARYSRNRDDPSTAEAAVTVLDSHCNRGIGTILLTSLADEALAHGITTFTASVMWENQVLLDSLRAIGAVVAPDEPGVAAVSVELPLDSKEFVGSAL
jgi:GNAT superfamily N-acetyltransferase